MTDPRKSPLARVLLFVAAGLVLFAAGIATGRYLATRSSAPAVAADAAPAFP